MSNDDAGATPLNHPDLFDLFGTFLLALGSLLRWNLPGQLPHLPIQFRQDTLSTT